MSILGRSGLLGPLTSTDPQSLGSPFPAPPLLQQPRTGITGRGSGLLEQAPRRTDAVALNDTPPAGAPRQLQNAWDSPNSLQLVIDEWETNRSEQTNVLDVLAQIDPYERARMVAEILKISIEEARLLIKAGKVAGWVWKLVVDEVGMKSFRWGVDGELAQIRYWLPMARARQAELFRRRHGR